ncbi:methionine adenosyltransferase [Mycoplasmopsis lipofaciens]|uniref:methionine adenosyltransferase n=1 Tax=Mycoplasmopsis lipofaciens TaxID=114884 RepID=UPI00048025B4|nr:methionine adenosyltransferase [Mycoplasmopsis lipofaciens]
MQKKLFTSESVGIGHPDKLCDQISDAILDAYLEKDVNSKVAIETLATQKFIVIAGEVYSKYKMSNDEIKNIVKQVLKEIYFDVPLKINEFEILIKINKQSPDIRQGVDLNGGEIGAGDQGIMFGYATNETHNYMPLAISLAHEIVKTAYIKIKNGEFKNAKFDMKSQVTIDYTDKNNIQIDTILFSCQTFEEVLINSKKIKWNNKLDCEFKQYITNVLLPEVVKKYNLKLPQNILINPTGQFIIGGVDSDTGLTGRKIIVDTYGGWSRHGGGAFSGKDATKVDRSAAYACRYVAKNLVAAGVADKLEIQLSYAIGVAKPISINIETFATEKVEKDLIIKCVSDLFDLTPAGIIDKLNLKKPIYKQTAVFGHFGRDDLNLPWEQLDMVDKIKKYIAK